MTKAEFDVIFEHLHAPNANDLGTRVVPDARNFVQIFGAVPIKPYKRKHRYATIDFDEDNVIFRYCSTPGQCHITFPVLLVHEESQERIVEYRDATSKGKRALRNTLENFQHIQDIAKSNGATSIPLK